MFVVLQNHHQLGIYTPFSSYSSFSLLNLTDTSKSDNVIEITINYFTELLKLSDGLLFTLCQLALVTESGSNKGIFMDNNIILNSYKKVVVVSPEGSGNGSLSA